MTPHLWLRRSWRPRVVVVRLAAPFPVWIPRHLEAPVARCHLRCSLQGQRPIETPRTNPPPPPPALVPIHGPPRTEIRRTNTPRINTLRINPPPLPPPPPLLPIHGPPRTEPPRTNPLRTSPPLKPPTAKISLQQCLFLICFHQDPQWREGPHPSPKTGAIGRIPVYFATFGLIMHNG